MYILPFSNKPIKKNRSKQPIKWFFFRGGGCRCGKSFFLPVSIFAIDSFFKKKARTNSPGTTGFFLISLPLQQSSAGHIRCARLLQGAIDPRQTGLNLSQFGSQPWHRRSHYGVTLLLGLGRAGG